MSLAVKSRTGVYTYAWGSLECRERRLPSMAYRRISCWREPLSSRRVPSTTMASPYSDTFSFMKRSALRILSLSVHHRNRLLGAGNPLPSRHTQKLSSTFGRTRLVDMGSDDSSAARSMLCSVSVICCTIFGDSTSVSEDIT